MKFSFPRPFLAWIVGLGLVLQLQAGPAPAPAAAPSAKPKVELPPLLKEAMANTGSDEGRWAYTETEITTEHLGGKKGDKVTRTIVRFDPSEPYIRQYTPILVEGREPTAADLKKYRKMGEDREKEAERMARSTNREHDDDILEKLIDQTSISVLAETPEAITYQIVPKKGARLAIIKVDKLRFQFRVSKQSKTIERFHIELLEPMGILLVASLKDLDLTADFGRADPKFPPVLQSVTGRGSGRLLLGRTASGETTMTRTDFTRVTPFDERLQVEIGPLKVLNRL